VSFSYDPTQLATSLKDRVRFDLHDVDSTDVLLQDEEILGLITLSQGGGTVPSRTRTLALAARAIATRYATDALSTISTIGFEVQVRAQQWDRTAKFWEKRAGAMNLQPPAEPCGEDPLFTIGQMDNHYPGGSGNWTPSPELSDLRVQEPGDLGLDTLDADVRW